MPARFELFIPAFNKIAQTVHDLAVSKGFWPDSGNDGEKIALMHSELSEALEGIRHGNGPSDHIPEFTAAEEELADCIIRIMDLAAKRKWRVAEAIAAKHAYNAGRPYRHGKAF